MILDELLTEALQLIRGLSKVEDLSIQPVNKAFLLYQKNNEE